LRGLNSDLDSAISGALHSSILDQERYVNVKRAPFAHAVHRLTYALRPLDTPSETKDGLWFWFSALFRDDPCLRLLEEHEEDLKQKFQRMTVRGLHQKLKSASYPPQDVRLIILGAHNARQTDALIDPVVLPPSPEPHQAIPQTHWRYPSVEQGTAPSQQVSISRAVSPPQVEPRRPLNSNADAYAQDLSPMDWFSSLTTVRSIPDEGLRQGSPHPEPSTLHRHSEHTSALLSFTGHFSSRDVDSNLPPAHANHARLSERLAKPGYRLPPPFEDMEIPDSLPPSPTAPAALPTAEMSSRQTLEAGATSQPAESTRTISNGYSSIYTSSSNLRHSTRPEILALGELGAVDSMPDPIKAVLDWRGRQAEGFKQTGRRKMRTPGVTWELPLGDYELSGEEDNQRKRRKPDVTWKLPPSIYKLSGEEDNQRKRWKPDITRELPPSFYKLSGEEDSQRRWRLPLIHRMEAVRGEAFEQTSLRKRRSPGVTWELPPGDYVVSRASSGSSRRISPPDPPLV